MTEEREPAGRMIVAVERPWGSALMGFTISAAGLTDRGRRRADNQDCILCTLASSGDGGIFAVADGMGGQRAGEVASAITVETLREELLPLLQDDAEGSQSRPRTDEPLTERMRAAIARCNERILQHAEEHPDTFGLGSTLTMALVRGSLAIIGNIGDSRTYRVRDGEIQRLTSDHSLVAQLAAIGRISQDDVYSHPQRSVIYRALGAESEAQPDIITERLQSGDTLVLCSDGLWEMVRDEYIRRAVVEAGGVEDAAQRLIDLANGNGGDDNISVIVVRIS